MTLVLTTESVFQKTWQTGGEGEDVTGSEIERQTSANFCWISSRCKFLATYLAASGYFWSQLVFLSPKVWLRKTSHYTNISMREIIWLDERWWDKDIKKYRYWKVCKNEYDEEWDVKKLCKNEDDEEWDVKKCVKMRMMRNGMLKSV